MKYEKIAMVQHTLHIVLIETADGFAFYITLIYLKR